MFSSNTTQVSSGGYEIQRSLRFNSADSAYLNRTPSTAGNRRTWTWSGWFKIGQLNINQYGLFSSRSGVDSTRFTFGLWSGNTILISDISSSNVGIMDFETAQVFRDPSAWYHVVMAVDTTQATNTNRLKLYVNGVQIFFSTANYPSQNADTGINAVIEHNTGKYALTGNFVDGYMTEINFIDGQALTPSSFGAFDAQTGVWGPTRYAGSYGTNGFYLNFSNNSNTTAATLGADYSGNGNNWTPNNFSVSAGAGNDSLVDVPTNFGVDTGVGGSVRGNYCTINPLDGPTSSSLIYTDGNLVSESTSDAALNCVNATIGVSSGKWYWELTVVSGDRCQVGVALSQANRNDYVGKDAYGWSIYQLNGTIYNNATATAYGSAWTTANDVLMIALDVDNSKIWFGKNGTWFASGNPAAGTNAAYTNVTGGALFPSIGDGSGSGVYKAAYNFGQRPFAYTAPSGFKALNTQNLPTPTIGATTATQAGKFFNPVTYTGNGTTQTISVGFQPDLVWIKNRANTSDHGLFDVLRGVTRRLESNTTAVENTISGVTAFTSDGFTIGSDYNNNGLALMSWNWKANGAGVTNTSGTITSTVSANTTSGFSVVTFTGSGTSLSTVGHGLGVAPRMFIVKCRSTAGLSWYVYQKDVGNTKFLELNETAGATTFNLWEDTDPTSSVFTLSNNAAVNGSGRTFVAYCFAEVPGYSRFGSYTGNGSTDGPFVFCGFSPAFLMIKRSDATSNAWVMYDNTRNTSNLTNKKLAANLSVEENNGADLGGDTLGIDLLSNGFKSVTQTGSNQNANGGTYIFAAFAESPFKYSLAR